MSATPIPRFDHEWRELDFWPAFNWNGGTDSWSALTYANWISGIDAAFSGQIASGTITKADLGASSDPTRRLYSYTAGNGPARVLLVGGTHGNEQIGQISSVRWFQWFATGRDELAVHLRRVLRVTCIPTLNPAGFRAQRKNANAVDLNRNYDFYWNAYTSANPLFAKGSAAWSEPETVIVRDLLQTQGIRCLIDCHDLDQPDPNTLEYTGPSPWALGNRRLVSAALETWQAIYNPSGTYSVADLTPNSGDPTLCNWASYAMRWAWGRSNAASLGIEVPNTIDGTTATFTSRTILKLYCGFMTCFILRWLHEGQLPVPVYRPSWQGFRDSEDAATSITAGGTKIDTDTATALSFPGVRPTNDINTPQTAIKASAICPGTFVVRASGYLTADPADTGTDDAGRVTFSITVNGVTIGHSITSVLVPDLVLNDDRVNFVCEGRYSVASIDAATIYSFALICDREWAKTFYLRRYRMIVDFVPNIPDQPVPLINP